MFYARLPFPKLSYPFRRVCVGIGTKGGEKKKRNNWNQNKKPKSINLVAISKEYKKVYYSATTDVAMARVVISYG